VVFEVTVYGLGSFFVVVTVRVTGYCGGASLVTVFVVLIYSGSLTVLVTVFTETSGVELPYEDRLEDEDDEPPYESSLAATVELAIASQPDASG
jgi:hypothetical protein